MDFPTVSLVFECPTYRVAVQKIYFSPILPSCVGFAYTARRKSKISASLTAIVNLFPFSLLVESKFKTCFPDMDLEALELVPYTNSQYLFECIYMAYPT